MRRAVSGGKPASPKLALTLSRAFAKLFLFVCSLLRLAINSYSLGIRPSAFPRIAAPVSGTALTTRPTVCGGEVRRAVTPAGLCSMRLVRAGRAWFFMVLTLCAVFSSVIVEISIVPSNQSQHPNWSAASRNRVPGCTSMVLCSSMQPVHAGSGDGIEFGPRRNAPGLTVVTCDRAGQPRYACSPLGLAWRSSVSWRGAACYDSGPS